MVLANNLSMIHVECRCNRICRIPSGQIPSLSNTFFCQSGQIFEVTRGYLGGVLAPLSHCSMLIETPLAVEAGQENDLSIAPVLTMDSIKILIIISNSFLVLDINITSEN